MVTELCHHEIGYGLYICNFLTAKSRPEEARFVVTFNHIKCAGLFATYPCENRKLNFSRLFIQDLLLRTKCQFINTRYRSELLKPVLKAMHLIVSS